MLWLASEEANGLVSFEPAVELGEPHEREPRACLDYPQGGQDVAPEARLRDADDGGGFGEGHGEAWGNWVRPGAHGVFSPGSVRRSGRRLTPR